MFACGGQARLLCSGRADIRDSCAAPVVAVMAFVPPASPVPAARAARRACWARCYRAGVPCWHPALLLLRHTDSPVELAVLEAAVDIGRVRWLGRRHIGLIW